MAVSAAVRRRPGIEEQRRAILAAAAGLFARSGTAAVSVAAIAKAAGVSRDTFYRCYDNKDVVVDALYERAVSARMLAITGEPDADFADPQWLTAAIDRMVDDLVAEHQVIRFLFVESADPQSRAHQLIEAAFDEVAANMQAWCTVAYGYAPSRDCFTGLLSASQWLVHRAVTGGTTVQIDSAKRAIGELFLATFRGLATPM